MLCIAKIYSYTLVDYHLSLPKSIVLITGFAGNRQASKEKTLFKGVAAERRTVLARRGLAGSGDDTYRRNDGIHQAVIARRNVEVESGVDRADVLFGSSLVQTQHLTNSDFGVAIGHQ